MSIFQVEEVEDDEVAEIDEDDDEVADVDEDVHILEDDDEAASEDCKKNGESNDCSAGEKKKGHVQKAAKENEKEEENKDGEDVITVDDSVEPDIVPKVILLFIFIMKCSLTYLGYLCVDLQ